MIYKSSLFTEDDHVVNVEEIGIKTMVNTCQKRGNWDLHKYLTSTLSTDPMGKVVVHADH